VSFLPEAEGATIVNTAFARADNADEAQDENTVGIEPGTAELAIVKESDKKEYIATETAIYTLTTTCVSSAPAINVVIADKLDTTAAAISEGSIKVTLGEDDITSSCAITASPQDFRIETGKALRESESIVVAYAVNFDKAFEGGEVKNTAVTFAANAGDVQDDNTVEVKPGKATLKIVKESDKTEYVVTETAIYTLAVTCVSSAPAINVVITDSLDTTAAAIRERSIKVTRSGEDITSGCAVTASPKDFRIETGKSLKEGESIVVTYEVDFDEAFSGGEVHNTAAASSSNSDEVSDDNEIEVTLPEEEMPAEDEETTPTEIDSPDGPKDTPKGGDTPKTGDSLLLPILIAIIALGTAGAITGRLYLRRKTGSR
jgi:uncharacterized repeat protein (TIGR01451 family)